MDNFKDHVWDKIAEARNTVNIAGIEIGDEIVTFDIRFRLSIARSIFDRLVELGANAEPQRSARGLMRRYVKYAFATLLPDDISTKKESNQ